MLLINHVENKKTVKCLWTWSWLWTEISIRFPKIREDNLCQQLWEENTVILNSFANNRCAKGKTVTKFGQRLVLHLPEMRAKLIVHTHI